EAENIAERVRSAIDQCVVKTESGEITYSASFGIAQAQPGMQLEQLIGQADKALYQAKERGKNRIEVFPVTVAAAL
ncbi:MAG: diguanylate cyclase, partial [Proteobacteria bacterium]|nr:diguanylate cyclase [Pseudomonadota bacterium]